MAIQRITKQLQPSGDVANKPIDSRSEVTNYQQLLAMAGAYVGLHVQVLTSWTDTSHEPAVVHPGGEYVVTDVNQYGDILAVVPVEEYLGLDQKQDKIDSSNKLNADLIQDGSTNKVVTQSEKDVWNSALQSETDPTVPSWAKQETKPSYTASEVGAIPDGDRGVANGVATLGSDGKVPQSQLPSYVDDVLEYSNQSSLPATGESGKIYVALDTNKTYRWSGSAYVEISQSLALGETSSTAFAGDRGKAIEDKIPSGASSSNQLATASDLNGKVDKVSGATLNNFAAFDSNGGIKDSNCNEGTFIKGVKQNGTAITPVNGVVDVTVQNGASAYEIWLEENGWTGQESLHPESEFLASLKAQFGSFVPADYYDDSGGSDEGKPASGGLVISPNQSTTNYIYLVDNNSDPTSATAKVMWITVVDETDPSNPTYSWQSIGEVQVSLLFKSGQSLDDVNIVNDLTTGGPTDVASAETVKTLNDILFNGEHETKFVNVTDSATQADSSDKNCWMVGAAGTEYENKWRARAETACISKYIHVSPGEIYKLQSTADTSFCVLNTLNFASNESVDFSTATGYTGMVSIQANTSLELTIPSDNTFNYIFFYTKYSWSDTGFSISKKTIINIEGVFPQLEDHEGRIGQLEDDVEALKGGDSEGETYDSDSPKIVEGYYFYMKNANDSVDIQVGDYIPRGKLAKKTSQNYTYNYIIVPFDKGDKVEVSCVCNNSSANSGVKTCIVVNPDIKVLALHYDVDTESTPYVYEATESRGFAIVNYVPNNTTNFYVKVTKKAVTTIDVPSYKSPRFCNIPCNFTKSDFRILDIGNSYTVDTSHYVGKLLQAAGVQIGQIGNTYPDFSLYRATIEGASFKDWCVCYEGSNTISGSLSWFTGRRYNAGVPPEEIIPEGSLDTDANPTPGDPDLLKKVLRAGKWDLIIIHQSSQFSSYYGGWNTTEEAGYLKQLIRILRSECPKAAIGTYLVHSYASSNIANLEESSELRWQHIAEATNKFVNDYGINVVIPYGTAAQNLRSSIDIPNPSDEYTSDGIHLNDTGDYAASCCYVQAIFAPKFGITVLGNSFRELASGTNISDELAKASQISAVSAISNMYELTNPDDVDEFDDYFQSQE